MTPKAAAMPAPATPIRIPSADDPDLMSARRLAAADEFAKRKGRDSTQLAGDVGAYSRTTLG